MKTNLNICSKKGSKKDDYMVVKDFSTSNLNFDEFIEDQFVSYTDPRNNEENKKKKMPLTNNTRPPIQ